MLWFAAATRTNWRISPRVVNTFFTILTIDFGLTDPEGTTHSDSTVEYLWTNLWVSPDWNIQAQTKSYPQPLKV
jgi:hypothetical protein